MSAAPPPAANSNLAMPVDPVSARRRREGPVMRGVRHVWNAAISMLLGAMIGLMGHQFAADAVARLWPDAVAVAEATRVMFWALGLGATAALFFSYYLDDRT